MWHSISIPLLLARGVDFHGECADDHGRGSGMPGDKHQYAIGGSFGLGAGMGFYGGGGGGC